MLYSNNAISEELFIFTGQKCFNSTNDVIFTVRMPPIAALIIRKYFISAIFSDFTILIAAYHLSTTSTISHLNLHGVSTFYQLIVTNKEIAQLLTSSEQTNIPGQNFSFALVIIISICLRLKRNRLQYPDIMLWCVCVGRSGGRGAVSTPYHTGILIR